MEVYEIKTQLTKSIGIFTFEGENSFHDPPLFCTSDFWDSSLSRKRGAGCCTFLNSSIRSVFFESLKARLLDALFWKGGKDTPVPFQRPIFFAQFQQVHSPCSQPKAPGVIQNNGATKKPPSSCSKGTRPGKLTWNLNITYQLKRKIIFQTSIFWVPCQSSGVQW